MSTILKRVLLGLLAVLVILQFFRIEKTNPPIDTGEDFLYLAAPPQEIGLLIKDACYDCHSYETQYPWYTNVAPISWWIADHVEEGRGELNFSTWAQYDAERRAHKLEEAAEEVGEGHMPLQSYTWVHGVSRLSDEQRERLAAWFEEQMGKEVVGQRVEQ